MMFGISLKNEYLLFKYNLKGVNKYIRNIDNWKRINMITCAFITFLIGAVMIFITNHLVSWFRELGMSKEACAYLVYGLLNLELILISIVFLGRVQDFGIPGWLAVAVIWGGVIAWSVMTHQEFLNDPDHLTVPFGGAFRIYNMPPYWNYIKGIIMMISFLPGRKKDNRYGKAKPNKLFNKTVELRLASFPGGIGDFFRSLVKDYFLKAFDFKGRIDRARYGYLFIILLGVIPTIWDIVVLYLASREYAWLIIAPIAFPMLALCVRRLHDCYLSAFWLFLLIMPNFRFVWMAMLALIVSWKPEDIDIESRSENNEI